MIYQTDKYFVQNRIVFFFTSQVNGITGESFTYNQLRDKITKVAGSLVKMGIKQGYVVTLFSPNCPEFAIMFLAVNRIGATISPLNPLYTPGR